MLIPVTAIAKFSRFTAAACSRAYSPAAIPQGLLRSTTIPTTFAKPSHGVQERCPSAQVAQVRAHLAHGDSKSCIPIVAKAHAAACMHSADRVASLARLRLVTTIFIHGLLKHDNAETASDVVADTLQGRAPLLPMSPHVLPIEYRVRLHTRTLDRTISKLSQHSSESVRRPRANYLRDHSDLRHWRRVVDAQFMSRAPTASPVRSNENIRRSVALLNAFRHYRYHRTEGMYERVIEACILQGEIVTATLLFVLLVRDWQARRSVQAAVTTTNNPSQGSNPDAPGTSYSVAGPSGKLPMKSLLARCAGVTGIPADEIKACGLLHVQPPPPNMRILWRLLNSIDQSASLVLEPGGPMISSSLPYHDAREALAYLAYLLHERAIPDSRVSYLVRALSKHRQHPDMTLTPQGVRRSWRTCMRGPESPSFHDLPIPDARMIVHLFQRSTRLSDGSVNGAYSETLRGLIGPMPWHKCCSLKGPLLDQRSFNALLYFALRDAKSLDLTRATLHLMHERGFKADIITLNTLLRGASLLRMNHAVEHLVHLIDRISPRSDLPDEFLHRGMRAEPRELRGVDVGDNTASLPSPDVTLSCLIPLSVEPGVMPTRHTLSSILAHRTSIGINRSLALRIFAIVKERLHELGADPVSLATILNMLVKAGMTGAAKAFFSAMRFAEDARPGDVEATARPPLLNIYAYTMMLGMFARERRNHLSVRKRAREAGGSKPRETPEPDASLEAGVELYHAVCANSRNMKDHFAAEMRNAGFDLPHIDVPIPDARFFNAAIPLITRTSSSVQRRRWPRRPGHSVTQTHRLAGNDMPTITSTSQLNILSTIKSDMEETLSYCPLGIHWLLRSRPDSQASPFHGPVPTRPRKHPYRIATPKTKGSPVRRRVTSQP